MKGWTAVGPALAAAVACGQERSAPAREPPARFQNARRVDIAGYPGSAMEPYISCDGRYLLFNNRNDPAEQTDLFAAERAADGGFRLLGPLTGANAPPPALDGVPSLDARGELFFISTRSYESTLSTLYSGSFDGGRVTSVALVPGNVSRRQRGWLTMDAEISRDGNLLYFASALFTGGQVPVQSDLAVARRTPEGFTVTDDSARLLAGVNTPSALEYAPATSADGRELFFTRLTGLSATILRSMRADAAAAFGPAVPVAGISGFVEAPSVTCDGAALFFHRRDGDEFSIYRAERER
jgi:hypothetical protein